MFSRVKVLETVCFGITKLSGVEFISRGLLQSVSFENFMWRGRLQSAVGVRSVLGNLNL